VKDVKTWRGGDPREMLEISKGVRGPLHSLRTSKVGVSENVRKITEKKTPPRRERGSQSSSIRVEVGSRIHGAGADGVTAELPGGEQTKSLRATSGRSAGIMFGFVWEEKAHGKRR